MKYITEETKILNALTAVKVSLSGNIKWTVGLSGNGTELHVCSFHGRGKHDTFNKLEIKTMLFNNMGNVMRNVKLQNILTDYHTGNNQNWSPQTGIMHNSLGSLSLHLRMTSLLPVQRCGNTTVLI